MIELFKKLKPEILKLIKDIAALAGAANYSVYLVGGFVRDILLGRENLDVDIVVEDSGIDFASLLANRLEAKIVTHKRFGTATITCRNGIKIDIATARKEVYLKPAELPCVCAGTIEDDLKRRDFSINALAISLNAKDFGKVIDLFNGGNDIKNGCLRILHDASFIDDPTRILRGIRFEQRFGFKFHNETRRLILQAKKLKMLEEVQKHRLRDELILILKEQEPLRVLLRLKLIYGLSFIDKNIKLDKATQKLFKNAEKQISQFRNNFPKKRNLDEWLIYLMILLRKFKKRELVNFCYQFAFHKGETKRIISYNRRLEYLKRFLSRDKIKPSRIYQLLEPLSYETILATLIILDNINIQKHIHSFLNIYNGTRLSVNGDDLKNLGIKPGPHFKDVLKKVLYAKLDKKLSHKEDELVLLKSAVCKK